MQQLLPHTLQIHSLARGQVLPTGPHQPGPQLPSQSPSQGAQGEDSVHGSLEGWTQTRAGDRKEIRVAKTRREREGCNRQMCTGHAGGSPRCVGVTQSLQGGAKLPGPQGTVICNQEQGPQFLRALASER